jgi:dienelactone hydrolase
MESTREQAGAVSLLTEEKKEASPPSGAAAAQGGRGGAGKPRRRLVRIAAALAGVVVLALVAAGFVLWRFDSRLERVEPATATVFRWPYYLYVPAEAEARAATGGTVHLLVLPNNTGRGDDDFSVHEHAAWMRVWRDSALAKELGVVALVPIFPRPAKDWQVYTHALDRDCLTTEIEGLVRLDLQLVAMIDDARAGLAKRGWKVGEKVLLSGFSANGMFVDRFTALHPERVLGAAVGSPGGWPIAPVAVNGGIVLRYPIGVSDVEELTGSPFDAAAYAKVPVLVFMGDQDANDSLQFGDGWDTEDKDLVELVFGATPVERWEDSEAIRKAAGAKTTFKLYPGVGHEVTGGMEAELREFLARVLADGR